MNQKKFDADRFRDRLFSLLEQKRLEAVSRVADSCGIPRTTLYAWIKYGTQPTIDGLWRIADYFDCSIDYLVGRKD